MRSRENNAIFTNIPIEDIEFYEQTNDELEKENKQLKILVELLYFKVELDDEQIELLNKILKGDSNE